ncbi:hypothetical protein D3C85_1053790 [compost metagenome]
MHSRRHHAFEHTQRLFDSLLQRRIKPGFFSAGRGHQRVGRKHLCHLQAWPRRQRIEVEQIDRRRKIDLSDFYRIAGFAGVDFHRRDVVALQNRKHFIGLLLVQPFEQIRLSATHQRHAQKYQQRACLHDARSRVSAVPTALRTSTLSKLMSTLYCPTCSCKRVKTSGLVISGRCIS